MSQSVQPLSEGEESAAAVGFGRDGCMFYRSASQEVKSGPYRAETWYEFKLEVDLEHGLGVGKDPQLL